MKPSAVRLRRIGVAVMAACVLVSAPVAATFDSGVVLLAQGGPQPRIANGRVEPHTMSAGLAEDLPALARTLTEPTWIGYAVPVIDGHHQMCDAHDPDTDVKKKAVFALSQLPPTEI